MNQALAYCVVILVVVAAASGYHFGKQSSQQPSIDTDIIERQQQDIKSLKDVVASLQEQLETRTYLTPASPVPGSGNINPHALRAEQETQVFTDRKGRELVATILEVEADTARIRRESDGREFVLAQAELVAEDRAFLQYLYSEKKKNSPSPSKQSVNDVDWESIFGK